MFSVVQCVQCHCELQKPWQRGSGARELCGHEMPVNMHENAFVCLDCDSKECCPGCGERMSHKTENVPMPAGWEDVPFSHWTKIKRKKRGKRKGGFAKGRIGFVPSPATEQMHRSCAQAIRWDQHKQKQKKPRRTYLPSLLTYCHDTSSSNTDPLDRQEKHILWSLCKRAIANSPDEFFFARSDR